MAPPRPSSPTSLLWAHQLKREHTLLSDEIGKIRTTLQNQDARLRDLELVVHSSKRTEQSEFTAFSERLTVLENSDDARNGRLDAVERQAKTTSAGLHAALGNLRKQLTTLQDSAQSAQAERQLIGDGLQTMQHRAQTLENRLEGQQRLIGQLRSEEGLNRAHHPEPLKDQFARLAEASRENSDGLADLQRTVRLLEGRSEAIARGTAGVEVLQNGEDTGRSKEDGETGVVPPAQQIEPSRIRREDNHQALAGPLVRGFHGEYQRGGEGRGQVADVLKCITKSQHRPQSWLAQCHELRRRIAREAGRRRRRISSLGPVARRASRRSSNLGRYLLDGRSSSLRTPLMSFFDIIGPRQPSEEDRTEQQRRRLQRLAMANRPSGL